MRTFFVFIMALILVQGAMGQDAKKSLKTASKNVKRYFLDPAANPGLLAEATKEMEVAFQSEEVNLDPEAWNIKGLTYNEIASSEINAKVLDPNYKIKVTDASLKAFMALQKAIKLSTHKSQIKEALEEIRYCEDHLNNAGIFLFQEQNYNEAFPFFEASLKANEILVANKEKSRLDEANLLNEQVFYTGVCAYFSDNSKAAIPYFEKLYMKGNAQPLVYVGLFSLTVEQNETKAFEYLDSGKKLYPDDNEILFAEINFYIKTNRYDQLVDKLNLAITKEPENVSVYNALGNVYDQIYQLKSNQISYTNPSFNKNMECIKIDSLGNKIKMDTINCRKELKRIENLKTEILEYFNKSLVTYYQAINIGKNYKYGDKNDCYFLNDKREKNYVDISLCDNQPFMDKDFEPFYSIGALYYNKAAGMVSKLNELSNDFSSDGTKKYNTLKTEMDGYFKQALPFFTKAETINPNDLSVLIALKEIYAREGDLQKSNEYKARIEKLGQ